ncbi:MAG: DUF192 domain-containing protein [Bacillota bacterium]|nr:DUF192 domain-containing protein [Bacillota bacterium]
MNKITLNGITVSVANTFLKRLIGMLNQKKPDMGKGLLITPCNQVHTFGMHFPIDIVFLSSGKVVYAKSYMPPNRISPLIKKADSVLELAAGTLESYCIKEDTFLEYREV